MILRRFMKHVTDQNWFAVGLDVLVVITGIFLGMQVTEWNDERKEQQKERYYLERLLNDMDRSIDAQAELLIHNKPIVNRADIINHNFAIRRNDKAAETYFLKHFKPLGNIDYLPTFYPDTLNELYDVGALQVMNSRNLQAAIYTLRQQYRDYLNPTEMVQEAAMAQFYKVEDKVRNLRIIKDQKVTGSMEANYAALLNDDSFVSSFALYVSAKRWGARVLLKFHRECVIFRNILAAELAKPAVSLNVRFTDNSFLDVQLSPEKLEE